MIREIFQRQTLATAPIRASAWAFLSVGLVWCASGCDADGGPLDPFVCTIGDATFAHVGEQECAMIPGLALPDTLPAPRGNIYGDDEDAAIFGLNLFYDARFSSNSDVRCASCHLPEKAFHDAEITSVDGVGDVPRNSPTTLNAARHASFFWGGRADSLWSQPLFAIEAENEMNFTRLQTAHAVGRLYPDEYESIFGPLPDLEDTARFPAAGKPGEASWEGMRLEDQDAINVVFANVGKAIAAFMRKSTGGETRLDAYLKGDSTALSDQEVEGLEIFAAVGCINCHNGPLLSDERFHNIGLQDPNAPDEGRAQAATVVLENEFSLFGPYADPVDFSLPDPEALEQEAASEAAKGAFRTPSLRHIAQTAPYGHRGTIETLEGIVDYHLAGGQPPTIGLLSPLLQPRVVSTSERDALLAFLRSLDVESPPPPWNDWPER